MMILQSTVIYPEEVKARAIAERVKSYDREVNNDTCIACKEGISCIDSRLCPDCLWKYKEKGITVNGVWFPYHYQTNLFNRV